MYACCNAVCVGKAHVASSAMLEVSYISECRYAIDMCSIVNAGMYSIEIQWAPLSIISNIPFTNLRYQNFYHSLCTFYIA